MGLLVLAVVLGAAACSSGRGSGGGTTVPKSSNWDPAGVQVVTTLGAQLKGSFPGDCGEFGMSPHAAYLASASAIPAPLPNAVGQCTVLDEILEIDSFDTAAHRDEFVSTRGRVLCERAKAGKIALPGLRWVVGDSWSIQPDSEGVTRRLATALGARYRLVGCPGAHADWEAAARDRALALVQVLVAAHVGCNDFQLQDRDLLHTDPHFAAGLPAAYGRCTVDDDTNVDIAVFSTTSLARDKWVPIDLSVTYCPSAPKSVAIVDGDWAGFSTKPAVAAKVRAALGGTTKLEHCK